MPAAEDALRLAGSIAFETLALVVWNVGSRSPRKLYEDSIRALSSIRRLAGASLIALLGAIFFLTGIVLVVPVLVDPRSEFSPVVIGTLAVALIVDFLIGGDVRSLVYSRREP